MWSAALARVTRCRSGNNYEQISVLEYTAYRLYNEITPLSYRVEDKMRLSKDKTRLTVNPSLTLAGIPPQAFEYRLGNRSALDWVIDQYQVCTDKRSGITSDPNREDDPQYIVRLVFTTRRHPDLNPWMSRSRAAARSGRGR